MDDRSIYVRLKELLQHEFPDYRWKITDTMVCKLITMIRSEK